MLYVYNMNLSSTYYTYPYHLDTDYYSLYPYSTIQINDGVYKDDVDVFGYFLMFMGLATMIGTTGCILYNIIFLSDVDFDGDADKDHPDVADHPDVRFFKEKHARFTKIFDNDDKSSSSSSNIDPIFYNRKEHIEYFTNEDTTDVTEIEKQWKSRIIWETTPRGNVAMYYNAYRQGFAYYSDSYITYSVLNAIAMKYVVMYRCLNFFIDSQSVPESFVSPILKMIIDEDKLDIAKKQKMLNPVNSSKNKSNNDVIGIRAGFQPFAKLKNYQMDKKILEPKPESLDNKSLDNKSLDIDPVKPIVKDSYFNKFIYMGKTANWSPLQIPPKKNNSIFDTNPTTSYDMVFDDAQKQQTQVLDYKSFKLSLSLPQP